MKKNRKPTKDDIIKACRRTALATVDTGFAVRSLLAAVNQSGGPQRDALVNAGLADIQRARLALAEAEGTFVATRGPNEP